MTPSTCCPATKHLNEHKVTRREAAQESELTLALTTQLRSQSSQQPCEAVVSPAPDLPMGLRPPRQLRAWFARMAVGVPASRAMSLRVHGLSPRLASCRSGPAQDRGLARACLPWVAFSRERVCGVHVQAPELGEGTRWCGRAVQCPDKEREIATCLSQGSERRRRGATRTAAGTAASVSPTGTFTCRQCPDSAGGRCRCHLGSQVRKAAFGDMPRSHADTGRAGVAGSPEGPEEGLSVWARTVFSQDLALASGTSPASWQPAAGQQCAHKDECARSGLTCSRPVRPVSVISL